MVFANKRSTEMCLSVRLQSHGRDLRLLGEGGLKLAVLADIGGSTMVGVEPFFSGSFLI